MWHRKQKTETLIVHIGVFAVLYKVLFHKFTGDVWTNKLFSAGFWGFLHLLSKPFVSCVGLSFCWFWFSVCVCFFPLLVVVWQIKLLCSGFCFCCFGFPWFGYVVCVFLLVSFCFFWRVKGQVRWPKGPPRLALKPSLFVLFLFCFCLFCFIVVGVCFFLLFLLLFYLEGFKGQVRWPFGPPHLTFESSLVVFVVCFWFVFVCVGMNQKTLFPPEKGSFFSFICFLFHFLVHFFFLFLTFFLPFLLSFLLCFVSFFLAFFLSLSFSLSPFLFPAFLFFLFFLVLLHSIFLCLSFFSLFACCFPVFLF